MSRITKIRGEFMGVKFEVKPTPLNIEKVKERISNMMREWYKENQPELYDKLEGGKLNVEPDENVSEESLQEMQKTLDALNSWKEDVDFRSEYIEAKAKACMKFDKPIQDEIWSRDDIELSTITEAWDFFCERRSVPLNGV